MIICYIMVVYNFLHDLWGCRSHTSWGISVTMVFVWKLKCLYSEKGGKVKLAVKWLKEMNQTSSWQISGPWTKPQPEGPHNSWGIWKKAIFFISFQSFSFKGLTRNFSHLLTLGDRIKLRLSFLADCAHLCDRKRLNGKWKETKVKWYENRKMRARYMKNMNDNANSTSLGHFLQSSSVV